MAAGSTRALPGELASRPGRNTTATRLIRYVFITLSLAFLAALLFAPLATLDRRGAREGLSRISASFADPDTGSAIRLTLMTAAVVVPLNTIFGLAAAWAIAKFDFRGKSFLITLIDLPLAISPVISGLVYVLLFGLQGWFGLWLQDHGFSIIFALPGIILATMFVTFPYVARELIPLMEQLGNDEEEAAITLGAGGWMTFFRVTLPKVRWALIYGVILCNARAMGEFGAVSVVSGHIRGLTNTMPLHIEILYNEYNFVGSVRGRIAPHVAGRGDARREIAGRAPRGRPPGRLMRARALEQARRLWQSLRVDPAKTSLGRWLAAAHVTIVLLLLLGVSMAAIRMLHTLADDEGKARVQLAGATAREDLRRLVEDTVTTARTLAERPTLQRLFSENRNEEITPLLKRFCESQGLDACALLSTPAPSSRRAAVPAAVTDAACGCHGVFAG